MSFTTTIPTDKHGNVYYGPTTTKEARELLTRIARTEGLAWSDQAMKEHVEAIVRNLRKAGYPGVAARIAREYL